MSDQPNPTGDAPRRQQVDIRVPDDVKHGSYANFLVVSHTAHEFTLDFCQLQPAESGQVAAEVIDRIRIAPTMVARVLQALNTNLTSYEERFGQVKALG